MDTIIRLIAGKPRTPQKPNRDSATTSLSRTHTRTSSTSSLTTATTATKSTPPVAIPVRNDRNNTLATILPHLVATRRDIVPPPGFNIKRDAIGKGEWEKEMLRRSRAHYDESGMREWWEGELEEMMKRTKLW
ncbi:MAG: hypothetical protein L6R40_005060 [Gallowayella cf. fulva]|nr:MAG: hypothetical protein L6R40_005060 [Xanthomendoza cf. fulva]